MLFVTAPFKLSAFASEITPPPDSIYDYQERDGRFLFTRIRQTMRMICYDQKVYDDLTLEDYEYVGFLLDVNERASTVRTEVASPYHNSALRIEDNDSKTLIIP